MNSVFEIKYLAVYQGQDPRVETSHLDPETIREIVGGEYEMIRPWPSYIVVFQNKERNSKFARIVQRAFYGKDENGCDNKKVYYVAGPFIIAAVKDFESNTLRSLDDWEINHYTNVILREIDEDEDEGEEENLLEDSVLLKLVFELEAILNASDKCAADENNHSNAPSVWQIQNAQIREKVNEIKGVVEREFEEKILGEDEMLCEDERLCEESDDFE